MSSSEIHHDEAIAEVEHELALLKNLADKAPTLPTGFGRPEKGLADDGFDTVQVARTPGSLRDLLRPSHAVPTAAGRTSS